VLFSVEFVSCLSLIPGFISHSPLPESIYQEDDFRLVSKREVKEATPIFEKSKKF